MNSLKQVLFPSLLCSGIISLITLITIPEFSLFMLKTNSTSIMKKRSIMILFIINSAGNAPASLTILSLLCVPLYALSSLSIVSLLAFSI